MGTEASGDTSVNAGDQTTIAMGYNPVSVVIKNTSNQHDTSYLYAWVYDDASLIGTNDAPTANVILKAGDSDTLNPTPKTGGAGTPVNPATLVVYNLGPNTLEVGKL